MAQLKQDPVIKVIGFKMTYERLPVRGNPVNDEVDAKGFKLDAKGKRFMEMQEVDWVCYAPAHSPINTQNWERIRHVEVTEEMLRGKTTEKLRAMKVRWSAIEERYRAWKSGHAMPEHGTPLAAWPGITPEKAEVLRRFGIVTVEEVANLAEGQMEKIQLPGMRDMRRSAGTFLENRGAAESAQRETERDKEIERLKEQLSDVQSKFSAAMDLLEEKTTPANDGGEVAELRAECDRRGIKYHPRNNAETLRSLLVEAQAA